MPIKYKRFSIRLTDFEYALLNERAKESKNSMTGVILQALKHQKLIIPPAKEINSLLISLSRIGNNINQIARELNSLKQVDTYQLREEMKDLSNVLETIQQNLIVENMEA